MEAAVSADLGRSWRVGSWTDLADRASHPALVLRDDGFAVFAKHAAGADGAAQLGVELDGLRLIGDRSGVDVPAPVAGGRVELPDGSAVMLVQALDERADRHPADWRAIGRALARIHRVTGETFGSTEDGYFGPLSQDNRPVDSDEWTEFYAVRRVLPWLRTARDADAIDAATVARMETLVGRLPELAGPRTSPRLLHGDAQHHNFVSTAKGAVVIDPSPYFGHPELDLALLDYFSPVPPQTWAGYQEIAPIDPGFAERRELWRIFAYLAVLTVDGDNDFGRRFRGRLTAALDHYLG
ncbi:fructosamine kinase family protein [Microlunatus elymi]|uniref:Fructosamine kinase family protein n=1 Tax=Microlunatus elymi TaxID=2596828 RepID=A0A516Q640_9ACTN|nr:fructosamine kinase family protein [Microlunatus elymi]